jgi:hypothetical protein
VLHHIPPRDQEKAVLDVWTRVRPGGIFLYKDMASKPFWCGWMNRLHDLASAKEWIHYCPISRVENAVNLGGGGGEVGEFSGVPNGLVSTRMANLCKSRKNVHRAAIVRLRFFKHSIKIGYMGVCYGMYDTFGSIASQYRAIKSAA